MIELSDLIDELESYVPPSSGIPSAAQYESAIKSAVADFGQRAGRVKIGTLSIVSGTASYSLPDDFLKFIAFIPLPEYGGIMVVGNQLVPTSLDWLEERYTIANRKITFFPTPGYTFDRSYSYKAGWAVSTVDDKTGYDDMSADEAGIVMLMARSSALGMQADASGGGISYRQGDVSVDTSGQAASLQGQADSLKQQYLETVQAYNGTVISR